MIIDTDYKSSGTLNYDVTLYIKISLKDVIMKWAIRHNELLYFKYILLIILMQQPHS